MKKDPKIVDDCSWFDDERKIALSFYQNVFFALFLQALQEYMIVPDDLFPIVQAALQEALKKNSIKGEIEANRLLRMIADLQIPLEHIERLNREKLELSRAYYSENHSSEDLSFFYKHFQSGLLIVACYPKTPLEEPDLLEKFLRKACTQTTLVFLDLAPSAGLFRRFRRFVFDPSRTPGFNPWQIECVSRNDLPEDIKSFLGNLYKEHYFLMSSDVLRGLLPHILENPLLEDY